MSHVIRIRNYRTYMLDGFGYAEYAHADKKKVFVALIVGDEPKKIENESQFFDVDSVILKMAENIKAARKAEKTAKAVVKKSAKKTKVSKKKTVKTP